MAKKKTTLHDSHPGSCDLDAQAAADAALREEKVREQTRARIARELEAQRPKADGDGQLLIPGVKPEELPPPPTARVWTWPGKSRCPRCSSIETVRVSDDGPTQYRRCTRPICRHSFKVQGNAI